MFNLFISFIGMIHIWRPWKLSSFQDRPHPSPFTSKILSPPWFWTSNFKRTPLPSHWMISNQLKENIIQGRLLYVIRSFLQVGFRFQYQLINLVWLSFDFFSFSWSFTIRISVVLYFCVQLSKNYSHFYYSFCNQPVLFAQLENVNKLWKNNRTVHETERNQNKKKTKSRHIQIDHAFYCLI